MGKGLSMRWALLIIFGIVAILNAGVATAAPAIEAYGKLPALHGVDLDVRRGEIIGVVGGSGTGKSVLMRSIIGLQIPDAGTIALSWARLAAKSLSAYFSGTSPVATLAAAGAGKDEKIIAVPSAHVTQRHDGINDYSDLPDILRQQVEHFFEHYKDLEPNKWTKILRWGNAEEARAMILEGIERAKTQG